uniref:DNA primase family protein n=1 Tax=Pandoraea pnomenusa TaxID=93220 RepID=UPI00042344F9|nr:phage/plasmid primase, P4 family [Pandoraea pnomenusa]
MSNFRPHDYAEHLRESGDFASDRSLLYRWTGVFWEVVPENFGEAMAYEWLVKNDKINASSRNATAAYEAAVLWVPLLPQVTNDCVIPCTNGYVHINDDGPLLAEPRKELGVQYSLSCPYAPNETKPKRFMGFLERVLPDKDVRERVQEYAGYTLTADARHQRAQFWIGGGANGKGVLANVIQALHGHVAAINLDSLDGFRLSVLIGASLIYCDEVPRKSINEQVLKSLIAGERVFIDRKYKDPLSLCVSGKWLVLGNHLPKIDDHSHGFWRRWDIVPFNVTIPEHEQNPLLAEDIIREELSGVLNWALEGLIRLRKRGSFSTVLPAAMTRAMHSAHVVTNNVKAWCAEQAVECFGEPDVSKDTVYSDYVTWCKETEVTPLGVTQFWMRLRDLFPSYNEFKVRQQNRSIRICNVVYETGS